MTASVHRRGLHDAYRYLAARGWHWRALNMTKPHIYLRDGQWHVVNRYPRPMTRCQNFHTACMYAKAATL